jgi:hypothetical protein
MELPLSTMSGMSAFLQTTFNNNTEYQILLKSLQYFRRFDMRMNGRIQPPLYAFALSRSVCAEEA